ncbi:MAG: hypothetical protein VW600_08175 [Ferrovibrio sp.]
MTADSFVLLTTILLLFPLGYLFLACPAFLLVQLSIPKVAVLLRAMFRGYFWMLMVIAPLALLADAMAGRTGLAFGMALLFMLAAAAHRLFLQHFDAALLARDSGDGGATRRLRRLHVAGMLANGVVLAAVIAGIPAVI